MGELGRLEGDDVAGEGDEVGLEGVDFVDTALQRPLAVEEGAGVDVGELHNLVAVEGGWEGGEGDLDLLDAVGVALDENAVGKQQHRHQQREQSPQEAATEGEVQQPRQQPGNS